jgi:hypothetical protein
LEPAKSLVQPSIGAPGEPPKEGRREEMFEGGDLSERFGFIDQHDGNSVFHRVDQPAAVADQRLGGRAVLEIPFTLGAYQNLE